MILLIGIVKKNAIMMIDFAIDAERTRGLRARRDPRSLPASVSPDHDDDDGGDARRHPPALGAGDGAEMRRPLGIAIVGGLMLSQLLTLYTTPVVYLYLDRFALWAKRKRTRGSRAAALAPTTP